MENRFGILLKKWWHCQPGAHYFCWKYHLKILCLKIRAQWIVRQLKREGVTLEIQCTSKQKKKDETCETGLMIKMAEQENNSISQIMKSTSITSSGNPNL